MVHISTTSIWEAEAEEGHKFKGSQGYIKWSLFTEKQKPTCYLAYQHDWENQECIGY